MTKENQIVLVDEQGNENLFEILFTFNSPEFKKDYVLVTPVGAEDEDGEVEVHAFSYVANESGELGDLNAVESDEEWEMIEEYFDSYMDENYGEEYCEECGHECGECCCEDEEDGECDKECCHHNHK